MLARRADGARDLSRIRNSASTARVLNLADISQRPQNLGAVQAQPMFVNRRLNQAIILKHAVRADERELFATARRTATKVILPFSGKDLHLGGVSFFVEQKGADAQLERLVGAGPDDFVSVRDRELLMHLSQLPCFDPFLLRERTRRAGLEIAACYFDVSDADLMRMQTFVTHEIRRLVLLAVGGNPAGVEATQLLTRRLLHDPEGPELAPLRDTLRLGPEEQKDCLFAWKGFLYYKWKLEELAAPLAALKAGLGRIRCADADPAGLAMVRASADRIMRSLEAAGVRIRLAVGVYDRAFHDLTARGGVAAFRSFLKEGPAMFLQIGSLIAAMTHVLSVWEYEFPQPRPGAPPAGDPLIGRALAILDDMESTLETTSALA